jgi:hypothetical protein
MTDEIKHGNEGASHGDYERRDIGVAGILYFLLGLAAATFVVHLLLAGMYDFLDKRARTHQPALNPLIENVPANQDTRKIPQHYADKAFPDPRLETDERTQLNDIRVGEEQTLNSYGYVDEKAGIVRIPIERAMDLLAQRGLPVRSQDAKTAGANQSAARLSAASPKTKSENKKKASAQ